MNELASVTIRAVSLVMELLAKFCLVHRWDVYLLLKFVFTMGEGAFVSVFARACCFPAGTQLSLDLNLVISGKKSSIVSESEWVFNFLFPLNLLRLKALR